MYFKKGILLAAMLASPLAFADIDVADRYVQNPDLVGKARMKVMLWDVFDATLYAENGQFDRTKPFVLSLSYLRKLKAEQIVDKTIEEMADQNRFTENELSSWSVQLSAIIDDVDANTTITGARNDAGNTLFYRNGQAIGQIADSRFTEGFFDIWLGDKTSQPRLRDQLLSAAQS